MNKLKKIKQKKAWSSIPMPTVGSTLVGERGQIVIPKEIRDDLGLAKGARLMVLHHSHGPIMLLPAECMQDFIKKVSRGLMALPSKK